MNALEMESQSGLTLTPLILVGSINGKQAHISPTIALEDLKVGITGKKILNTPYTLCQCLKHLRYWQDKYLRLLNGEAVTLDHSWQEGWESVLNACNQSELDAEIQKFTHTISKVEDILNKNPGQLNRPIACYETGFHLIQAMGSHISYHIGEIVLLRRIFGAWPPPSGGYTW